MKINGKMLSGILFTISLISSSFATDNRAHEILSKAQELALSREFTAELVNPDRPLPKQYIWFKKTADGTICNRIETILASGDKMVLLTNSTGKFTIIGKKVIRNAPIPKPEKTVTASSKITKRFSCLEGKYGAIPCYIVTEEFQNSPIQKIVYSIGQKDYFIYQKNIYDSNGAKISTLAYTNVKLNPHINDSIFELPEDTQVQMPENAKEEREIITKTVSSALCSKTCHQ